MCVPNRSLCRFDSIGDWCDPHHDVRQMRVDMDRHVLKHPFTLRRTHHWMCPTCGQALLRIREDSFVKEEQSSSRDHSDEEWQPEWIRYVYSCMLVCSNVQCKEVVASSGTGSVHWHIEEDMNGVPQQVYEDHFRPKFFQPHLQIFQIPEACPCSVAKPLEDSFALFFAAPDSAIASVRTAMKALLGEMMLSRFSATSGERRSINLHQSIALLDPKYAHLKDVILAIKWLADDGSQDEGVSISIDDVMDAYELTEKILEAVYTPKLPTTLKPMTP